MSNEDRKDEQPTPPKGEDPSPDVEGVLKAITGSDREKGIQLSGEDPKE